MALKRHEKKRIFDMIDAGLPVKDISVRTGASIATVYNYKRNGPGLLNTHYEKDTAIELYPEFSRHKELIDPYIKRGRKKTEIFYVLQKSGYIGRVDSFNKYYERRKQELRPARPYKPLQTNPGEEAQVDWGHFGSININGKSEKVYLFAFTLSWSRAVYLEFVTHQNQKTLQACHIHAFENLGIPKKILYDNMKTVVRGRQKIDKGQWEVIYNEDFSDFAKYYQFKPEACAPYWPRSKGKIERHIGYVRDYFNRYTPKMHADIGEANKHLLRFTNDVANSRKKKSTNRQPKEMWLDEKQYLSLTDNIPPYNLSPYLSRRATHHGVITFSGVSYSLGSEYARKKIDVREILRHGIPFLEIYYQDQLLKELAVPSADCKWVDVEPTLASEIIEEKLDTNTQSTVKRASKKEGLQKISVEERDLAYYSVSSLQQLETAHG